MGSYLRNKLQDMILVGAPRVGFHPAIPYHRQGLHPLIKEHAQYVSCDRAIVNGLIICKIVIKSLRTPAGTKRLFLNIFSNFINSRPKNIQLPIPLSITKWKVIRRILVLHPTWRQKLYLRKKMSLSPMS